MSLRPGHLIDFRTVEWDGEDRWRWAMRYLGADDHGMWLGAPIASLRVRPNQVVERIQRPVVRLLPSTGLWCAMWNHLADLDVYVDVCAEPEWDGWTCRVRDLELDVVRYRDGSVEILDEHEFEAARPRYPPNLVTLALEEASRLDSALRDATAPFNASPLRWLLTTAGLEPAVFAGVAG